ncbi:MAG: UbiA family prenyltransferase [Rhodobacteraceae bacterium]|nr:UbiA family prenyltransferase [Paracoccaceae bacterium]
MNDKSLAGKTLVVDADGTLLATDMLVECFWAALGKQPVACLFVVARSFTKPAILKQRLAALAGLNVGLLPRRPEVVAFIEQARRQGRHVIVASGSDQGLVKILSEAVGLGNDSMASDGQINLTSTRKAAALEKRFGKAGFDYIGDSRADIAVWKSADKAIVVAPSRRLTKSLATLGKPVEIIGKPMRWADLLRAFRPHQWVKNVLLFLPLLAAHRTDLTGLLLVLWGIAAFSAAASSIYIVNDLLDLEADRLHETKHRRPFASGAVSLMTGMFAGFCLGAFALLTAGLHSWQLAAIIAVYMALSLSYSLILKRLRWVDVAVLAALYTLRVVAGSIAAGVAMSGWLAAFIFPIFLALGCVKRLVELGKAKDDNRLPGRGYARTDRGDLLNIGITAAVGALIVYGLYTYSSIALTLYSHPWELRLAGVAVAFWLMRMIRRGWQGKMDYDPIVFALRDPLGLAFIATGGILLFNAAGVI